MPIDSIFFQAESISINSDYILFFFQVNLAVNFKIKMFDKKSIRIGVFFL